LEGSRPGHELVVGEHLVAVADECVEETVKAPRHRGVQHEVDRVVVADRVVVVRGRELHKVHQLTAISASQTQTICRLSQSNISALVC